jgi:hypothetical protein
MMTRAARTVVLTVALGLVCFACKRPVHGGGGPPSGGGARGGEFVPTAIALVKISTDCVAIKEDPVNARSDDSVVWVVLAQAGCGFENQTVEIRFVGGKDPGQCNCSDRFNRNLAKLRLKVKAHQAHETYEYEIWVNGQRISDPRLEVDP